MNSFLVEHQNIAIPIIEWGGLLLFLLIILSPFLIIRHHRFKPTRWWHIVGAYASSFAIFFLIQGFLFQIEVDQWISRNLFTTWELKGAYNDASFKNWLWLIVAYPSLVFYSAKMMYGSLTDKQRSNAFLIFAVFAFLLVWAVAYVVLWGVGQAFMSHF